MGFDPIAFGARLRALVGDMPIAAYARRAGIREFTLARYMNGEVARPGFPEIVAIGMVRGLRPTDVAALAGLYPVEETEAETINRLGGRLLEHLQTSLMHAHGADERELTAMLADLLEIRRRRLDRERQPGVHWADLPNWVRTKLA